MRRTRALCLAIALSSVTPRADAADCKTLLFAAVETPTPDQYRARVQDFAAAQQTCCAGDDRAFRDLYARHTGDLNRYFCSAVFDPETVTELLQETWMAIVRLRARYEATRPFRHLLFAIAHNHLVSHIRRYRPSQELPEDLVDESPRPEDEAQLAEEGRRLRAALATLPDVQRQAVMLRLNGMTIEEIAAVQEVMVEAAKSRLRYGLAKLRDVLDD